MLFPIFKRAENSSDFMYFMLIDESNEAQTLYQPQIMIK